MVLLRLILICVTGFVLVSCKKEMKRFSRLDSAETGISFSNRITENDTMNILAFEYVYNGGGVAMGDFNNDSLVDVYFTGNQVDNKLYLNKGDFKFEDITGKAGVAAPDKWSSGVALVDINADGKLDIYVCNTVKKVAAQRENLLFVNQGNDKDNVPVFKEMAKEYGIADTTHTTNAAFLDYDNDGDLDLFLLVNEMDNIYYPNKYHEKIKDGSSRRTDRLYRNDWDNEQNHPVYTNVSKEAGILIEGYGLGVNVTDINQDGWKDIYVTNDYITNDLMYINNGNGTFTDQAGKYFGHTSYSAMGNDVADINNDGLPDIVALDMMPATNRRKKMMTPANSYITYQNNERWGYGYQVARNTLQLNAGKARKADAHPAFGEIGLLSGIAQTDWSWTPMVTDFDNDGFRDIIITNGFPKDITDMDFMVYRASVERIMTPAMLLEKVPSVKISNFAFRNKGDLQFDDVTQDWGLEFPGFSNGAAYADLDNDGDMDYVVNAINDSASVYRNNSIQLHPAESNYLKINFKGKEHNPGGIGAIAEIRYAGNATQFSENSPYRGYLSSIEPGVHFGLGKISKIDEVKITWPDGKIQIIRNVMASRLLNVYENDAKPASSIVKDTPQYFEDISQTLALPYKHEEDDVIDFNTQKLLPHKLSQYGPALAVGDINNDGLEDVFVGGSMGHTGHFMIQQPNGQFKIIDKLLGLTVVAKNTEDMGVLLFDADLDNDLDLYIVSGSYEANANTDQLQDRFYENDGKGNFRQNLTALPRFLKSGSCVKAADFDRDGDLDLFIGGRVEPAMYPKPVSSYVLRNDSNKQRTKFTDVSAMVAPELKEIGLICDGLWTDVDNDGWVDLLLTGEWMPLTLLKNNSGKLKRTDTGIDDKVGLWGGITSGDFDNDGDMDYIAGNLGVNNFLQASDERPAGMYAADFNKDGYYDAIPTAFYRADDGNFREFPYNNRDEMGKQIIQVRQRFQEYAKFSTAGINDIFKPEELKEAIILKANWTKSSYIENLGSGKFAIKPLPIVAQMAPLFGTVAEDFDGDGNLDVLLAGNDYGSDLVVGRYDAFHGLMLKGDGKGNFKALPASQSGYATNGNAKALVSLAYGKNALLTLTSQNRDALCIHKFAKPTRQIDMKPAEQAVLLTYKNGKKRRQEIGYGSSFLSQSSRKLFLSNDVVSVDAIDFKGLKRKVL